MSYCRFSDLNGLCDVYVYEDVSGGWTTHVATRRMPAGAPRAPLELLMVGNAAATEAYRVYEEAYADWYNSHEHEDIDHPEAGARFNHATPGECADNLQRLRVSNLIVPHYAIQALRREQSAMDDDGA